MIAYKIPIVFCFAHSRALPITKCTLSRRLYVSLSLSRDCNVCPVHKNFLDVSSDGGSASGRSLSWPVLFVVAFFVCFWLAALARIESQLHPPSASSLSITHSRIFQHTRLPVHRCRRRRFVPGHVCILPALCKCSNWNCSALFTHSLTHIQTLRHIDRHT